MNNKGAGVVPAIIITAIVTVMICYIAFQLWVYNNTLTTGAETGIISSQAIGKTTTNVPFSYPTQRKMIVLKNMIDKEYLYEYDEEEMADMIATGMIASLDDPYAEYYDKDRFESFYTSTVGEYYGIGIYVTYDEDKHMPVVIVPLEGSPAEEVGLKTADYIEYVDDLDSLEHSYEEMVDAIKGLPGSYTRIGIIRKNKDTKEDEHLEFSVERRKVELNPVKHEVIEGNIGYIRLTSFDESSTSKFKNAYNELIKDKKVASLIIDLRDNPGGVLDVCKEITDVIVPEGKIVYSLDKSGKEEAYYSDEKQINIPLVVLVNNNSASASEVFTAAVKDYKVGTIVGETTYGKGVVQTLKPLGDGTYVKITTSEYYSPNGNKINGIGVTPDIEVSLPEEFESTYGLERKDDTQLQKAIEILK